jgi:Uncharacterized protein conserved in archaea
MTENDSMFDRMEEEIELLNRHIEMLRVTKEFQPIGIIRLSEILNMPKHKVRYSLRLLEKDGLIVATTDGAMVSEKYHKFTEELPRKLDDLVLLLEKTRAESSKMKDNDK